MNNTRAILLMIAAMVGFSLEDVFIKAMTKGLPVAQVLVFIGLGGSLVFAALTLAQRGTLAPLVHRDMASRAMLARNLAEGASTIFFVTALSLVPLGTVAAVFQATPLAITAGAALILGEAVGWRRWSAIGVGFIGVLMIIRPGAADFDANALLPLVAVIGIAARDLITRRLDPSIPTTSVAFYGFASVFLAGLLLLPFSPPPIWPNTAGWAYVAGAVLFGVGGYYAIVLAMRLGEAGAVMPFRYTRLVFSLLLGVVVFNERPDGWTLLGASIVIATGLYTFVREARLQRVR
ncbi:DMT family transporter [Aliiroseovarius subalbicans]|uniref:DMT family transporter n=1 Tax=Aliiroseovarius subalbicans TaxID=2925840 RepID=UPI001F58E3C7|nr:DMT family transporter [Aliiroseovarius subalbicans]MCI2398770.1 DMT family transporter [Aliiroseovarius subalbicans]